jgi:signal peptidase
LAVALAVVPRLNDGAALTVLTGSMEPTLAPGDMIVVKGVNEANAESEVQIGDVITFMPYPDDPTLITHRVISKSINPVEGTTYVTQGDANTAPDEPITAKQIRGEFMYAVPYIGHVTSWFSNNVPWAVAAGGAVLISYGLFSVIRGAGRRRESQEGTDAAPVEPVTPAAATRAVPWAQVPVAPASPAVPAYQAPAAAVPEAAAPAPARRAIRWAKPATASAAPTADAVQPAAPVDFGAQSFTPEPLPAGPHTLSGEPVPNGPTAVENRQPDPTSADNPLLTPQLAAEIAALASPPAGWDNVAAPLAAPVPRQWAANGPAGAAANQTEPAAPTWRPAPSPAMGANLVAAEGAPENGIGHQTAPSNRVRPLPNRRAPELSELPDPPQGWENVPPPLAMPAPRQTPPR